MKILKDIAFFGVDSLRSRAYLSLLVDSEFLPSAFFFLDLAGPHSSPKSEWFDAATPARSYATKHGLPVIDIASSELNSAETAAAIRKANQSTFIFSGPPGGILKSPIFETGKRFLHIHPGLLPTHRGSTTIYYSLLEQGFVGASALLLDANIDEGPVIGSQTFVAPKAGSVDLDRIYDPWVRATLLRNVIQTYVDKNEFETTTQSDKDAQTFFVIHPVLKTIAIHSLDKS